MVDDFIYICRVIAPLIDNKRHEEARGKCEGNCKARCEKGLPPQPVTIRVALRGDVNIGHVLHEREHGDRRAHHQKGVSE